MTPQEAAQTAAEAIRVLNHATLPGAVDLDVNDVDDVLASLALMSARLPQALAQPEALLDDRVENGQVMIVDGAQHGDPVAAAAIVGHWIAFSHTAADQLTHGLDAAQQTLTWAARHSLGKQHCGK